jgi:hypothetical protein
VEDGPRRNEDEEIERYSEKDAETVLNRFGMLVLWAAVGVGVFVVAGSLGRADLAGYLYIVWGVLRLLLPDYWPLGPTDVRHPAVRSPFPSGSIVIFVGLLLVFVERYPGVITWWMFLIGYICWMILRHINVARKVHR